jgi:ParB family transcriptional regulator, chromosome partitioning protein
VKGAIKAELPVIDVLRFDADEAADAMRALAESVIRASMSSVDIWRKIDQLESLGWNEQAIADALARPVRTVRRLKLLAHLHPPMLDVMALGSMPSEDQLCTIAAASRDEQAQVWKKHRPKKGQAELLCDFPEGAASVIESPDLTEHCRIPLGELEHLPVANNTAA